MLYAYLIVLLLFLFSIVALLAYLIKYVENLLDYLIVYVVCYVVASGMVGNMGKDQAHSNLAYAKIRVRTILSDMEIDEVFMEHALMSVMGRHA